MNTHTATTETANLTDPNGARRAERLAERVAAKLAALTDRQLIDARIVLDAKASTSPEENRTASWLAGELERRYPALNDILDGYFEDGTCDRLGYGEMLALAHAQVTA